MTDSTRNILTSLQTFQLNVWCLNTQGSFNGRTREHIADQASKELGFKVTVPNLSACLKTHSISVERGSPRKSSKGTDRVQVLAKEVAELFKALGLPVPENITAIVQRKVPK